MRILIISHQRSGATSFGKWLAMELGYIWIHEPFNLDPRDWNHNRNIKIQYMYNLKNIVCKCLYGQFLNKEKIKALIIKFDKVILLKRNNIKDSVISELITKDSGVYHHEYNITDKWLIDNEKRIQDAMPNFIELNNEISSLDGLQITYEGIYDNKQDIQKVKEYIGIVDTLYLDKLDKKYRYRKQLKTKSLI
jgi:hypothetical protein